MFSPNPESSNSRREITQHLNTSGNSFGNILIHIMVHVANKQQTIIRIFFMWNRVDCQRSEEKKIQNTQEVKQNASWLDKTGQNVRIFEEVLFLQATYNIKT